VAVAIRGAGGELLRDVGLFDVYAGPPLAESERSLAWRLTFSAPDRTLTDGEVEAAMRAIIADVSVQVGGRVQCLEQGRLARHGVVDRDGAFERQPAALLLRRPGRLASFSCDRHGNISLETASSIWSGRKGFTTQALAPAIWPSSLRFSRDSVVSMMIGTKR